jgi:hypothetical protein
MVSLSPLSSPQTEYRKARQAKREFGRSCGKDEAKRPFILWYRLRMDRTAAKSSRLGENLVALAGRLPRRDAVLSLGV